MGQHELAARPGNSLTDKIREGSIGDPYPMMEWPKSSTTGGRIVDHWSERHDPARVERPMAFVIVSLDVFEIDGLFDA